MDPTADTRKTTRILPTVVVVSSSAEFLMTCEDAIDPFPVVRLPSVEAAVAQLGSIRPALIVFEKPLANGDDARVRDVAVAVGARVLSGVPMQGATVVLRAALQALPEGC